MQTKSENVVHQKMPAGGRVILAEYCLWNYTAYNAFITVALQSFENHLLTARRETGFSQHCRDGSGRGEATKKTDKFAAVGQGPFVPINCGLHKHAQFLKEADWLVLEDGGCGVVEVGKEANEDVGDGGVGDGSARDHLVVGGGCAEPDRRRGAPDDGNVPDWDNVVESLCRSAATWSNK